MLFTFYTHGTHIYWLFILFVHYTGTESGQIWQQQAIAPAGVRSNGDVHSLMTCSQTQWKSENVSLPSRYGLRTTREFKKMLIVAPTAVALRGSFCTKKHLMSVSCLRPFKVMRKEQIYYVLINFISKLAGDVTILLIEAGHLAQKSLWMQHMA